jgi:hypothetical protein
MPDEHCLELAVPDSLEPTRWDLHLELFAASHPDSPVVVISPGDHPEWGLANVTVEGAARDTVPDLPRIFAFDWVERTAELDADRDGYLREFDLRWDANLLIPGDSAWVYVDLWGGDGSRFFSLGRSATYRLRGVEVDTASVSIRVEPENLTPRSWDLLLQLYDAEAETLAAEASPQGFGALAAVLVEGAAADTAASPDPPDTLEAWVGVARPNPSQGGLKIPLSVPAGGTEVTLEVRDIAGRMVWREGPYPMPSGGSDLTWDGREQSGRRAATGLYLVRVILGGQVWDQRWMVLR